MNSESFIDHLARGGEKTVLTGNGGSCTYRALHQRIEALSAQLTARGVVSQAVLLSADYSADNIALLFALWRNNNLVAITLPIEETKIAALANAAGCSHRLKISHEGELVIDGHQADNPRATVDDLLKQEAGFIIFSSGTTGAPKGIVHRLAPFLTRYLQAPACGNILAFLLFDHIGGLVTILQALATYGTLVLPQERSPHEVSRCVTQYAVETLHVSPTLLNLVCSSGAFSQRNMQSLQRIYFGSEPAPAALLQRVAQLLPKVALCQLYGMSEIGVLPCIPHPQDRSWFTLDAPGFDLRINDNILEVKATTTMAGYLTHRGNFTPDGYFVTEDMAEQDGRYFRVMGRASDLINVGGKKVMPGEVEKTLRELENVVDVVVYGQPNPLLGQIVAACFYLAEAEPTADLQARIFRHCRTLLNPEQIPRSISVSATPLYSSRFKKVRRPEDIAAL